MALSSFTLLQYSQVMSNSHRHMETEYDRLPVSALPSKFGVQYVTPRQDQAHRGTCWDFATIGLLEQSYRENGVRNGWLEPEEYVAFSEQAYGVEIMKLCTGPEDSQQQVNCRVAGDSVSSVFRQVNLKQSIHPFTLHVDVAKLY
jgi:hypothetical protein